MKPQPNVPRVALTRAEAAQSLGLSMSSFQRHVQPDLKLIRRGAMVLVPLRELERWAEKLADYTLP